MTFVLAVILKEKMVRSSGIVCLDQSRKMLMILTVIRSASTISSVQVALTITAMILLLMHRGIAAELVPVVQKQRDGRRSEEALNTSSLRSLLGRVDHRPLTRGTQEMMRKAILQNHSRDEHGDTERAALEVLELMSLS